MNKNTSQALRAQSALQTTFIADAIAMPLHWYYQVMDIDRAFPSGIQKFEAPPAHHPSSIMSLHSTTSGGRQSKSKKQAQQVVGEVILKGRAHHWDVPNVHYHQGMQAGENTLNAHCTRVLMRSLVDKAGEYDTESFVLDYISFMTANPPRHNDTYAESYHRGFFANYIRGRSPLKCAAKTHDTASIGALVTLAPLVFVSYLRNEAIPAIQEACRDHLALTHPDDALMRVSDRYVVLLCGLMEATDDNAVSALLIEAAKNHGGFDLKGLINRGLPDRQVVGSIFSSACYISDAWPVVLYFAYKYRHNPWQGLLANTNVGGDNVHRGMVLGTMLGMLTNSIAEQWFDKLVDYEGISQEISMLLSLANVPK